MNESFTPDRSPDEEPDPLLAALRQRLGVDYGQEPSPELWAGIRQRLPAAAPRPWWLRTRRLLPLLAGLLLVSLVLVRQAPRAPLTSQPAPGATTGQLRPDAPAAAPTRLPAGPAMPATALAGRPAAIGAAAASGAVSPGRALAAGRAATALGAAAPQHAEGYHLRGGHRPSAPRAQNFGPASRSSSATAQPVGRLLAQARNLRHRPATRELAREGVADRGSRAAGQPWAAALRQATLARLADRLLAGVEKARRSRTAAARRPVPASAPADAAAFTKRQPLAEPASSYATARRRGRAIEAGAKSNSLALSSQRAVQEVAGRGAGTDTLAFRRVGLLLASQLPAPLAARPDSFAPRLAPVRRWALLGLAGPTLSYRTLPPAGGGLAYAPLPSATTSSAGTRASTSPDYASLERPAAGLGAQVQVRRVLTGRWALALGLGYQEYATRLKLQVSTRRRYAASPSNYQGPDTTITVDQRDTYRLLTLPVQLSYALGPPRGRLALGLLGGAEPGWYLGGRTTENSSCSCQQQSFSSASGSPYSTLSLAVSLGLDVRYRLGGPASRWQLVVQPTGRYITSAFVRSTSLGYVRRQPYSFGLFTGMAWEF